jgi:hypothetical protein
MKWYYIPMNYLVVCVSLFHEIMYFIPERLQVAGNRNLLNLNDDSVTISLSFFSLVGLSLASSLTFMT